MTKLKIHDDGDILWVSGEVDMDSSPRVLGALRARLDNRRSVSIDLQGVSYVDSSGVAVLVQGFKIAHRSSVDFVIRNPSPQVRSVLELSQLHEFFVIDDDSGSTP